MGFGERGAHIDICSWNFLRLLNFYRIPHVCSSAKVIFYGDFIPTMCKGTRLSGLSHVVSYSFLYELVFHIYVVSEDMILWDTRLHASHGIC